MREKKGRVDGLRFVSAENRKTVQTHVLFLWLLRACLPGHFIIIRCSMERLFISSRIKKARAEENI